MGCTPTLCLSQMHLHCGWGPGFPDPQDISSLTSLFGMAELQAASASLWARSVNVRGSGIAFWRWMGVEVPRGPHVGKGRETVDERQHPQTSPSVLIVQCVMCLACLIHGSQTASGGHGQESLKFQNGGPPATCRDQLYEFQRLKKTQMS